MDHSESNIYLSCDNQNIYCYSLEKIHSDDPNQAIRSKQKKCLIHKKKVTAMCLSVDGQYLISGDYTGIIYVWSTSAIHSSDENSTGLISTYELHKDKGQITNLVALTRPLSLFGLTANMKSFEVPEIHPL